MINRKKYQGKGRPRKQDYFPSWLGMAIAIIIALICFLLAVFFKGEEKRNAAYQEYLNREKKDGFLSPLSDQHVFLNERLGTTASIINRILDRYHSPMYGMGDTFVNAGRQYNIDPVLLFAVAGVESTFGRFAPPNYNAFGWNHGKVAFNSYGDAIYTIASKIAILGYYKEYRAKKTVVSFARAYNKPYWQSYVGKLQWFIDLYQAYLKEVLKEVLKHNKVGWGFNTRYDKGFNDGYNQAVCELNQEIRKLKGE